MNKPVRVLIFLGAVLLVLAAMALLGVRSGDRSALQRYQAELAAKGEKLTFAELTRGRQTNAVDSHALLTNATAKLKGGRLAPSLLEPRRYVGPGQASVAWRQASPKWTQSPGPDSSGTWEEFAAQMIRVAVAGLGLATTWDALQAPGWTEPQLERLQEAWEPVDLVEAVEKGLLGARAGAYEWFVRARHSSGPETSRLFRASWNLGSSSPTATLENVARDYLYFPAYKLTSFDADELLYLKTAQESIAALRLVKAHRPWPEVKQAMLKAGARLGTTGRWSDRFRYFISLAGTPYYLKTGGTAINAEAERQMTLAAIALKRFQLRHGQLPPSLEALVPELLPAVPYDYMSAKPLCYRPKPDGGYVLYSVGLDGKDDGGDPNPPPGASPGLWGGRDAVWPSPATEPGKPPRQPDR